MEMRSLNGPSPKEEKPILSTRVGLAHASSEKKRDVDPPHNGPPTAIASALDACGNKKFIKPACISSQTWQQEIQK
jgi:hypothetical protein